MLSPRPSIVPTARCLNSPPPVNRKVPFRQQRRIYNALAYVVSPGATRLVDDGAAFSTDTVALTSVATVGAPSMPRGLGSRMVAMWDILVASLRLRATEKKHEGVRDDGRLTADR